ncbi:uncharacterized protein LOC116258126 isoform X1 [Nymphaea colorata]|uniref:uncharacterized protein LOC116258126 isoform X1 n=1 Tax=Nymphaea colorata TaxID=210225 RepID=UPI00214F2D84|nr:uncharacterized protein LOC116258126 isoform X1 [Nymphaea colorata]
MEEELEPLFDYSRVQPIVLSDDDSLDVAPPIHNEKRQKCSTSTVQKVEIDAVVIADDEEDWLPPPPKAASNGENVSKESSILLELSWRSCNWVQMKSQSDGDVCPVREPWTRRQELALLTSESVDDVFRVAEESALRELQSYGEKVEHESVHCERDKIILSIQDKDGLKQFRVYKDDKLEKLFKMYAEKVKGDLEKLVFCFDGDKVSPTATPEALGLENDDMLEAHIKTH